MLYPVANIDADVSEVEGVAAVPTSDVSVRILSGLNDATELSTTGAVNRASAKLDLGETMLGGTTSAEFRISASSNDGEQDRVDAAVPGTGNGPGGIFEPGSGGCCSLTSSDLELTQESDNQVIGLRFTNVNVPRGATITSAELEFEIDEEHSDVTNLVIYGDASDNSAALSNSNGNITDRPATSMTVAWTNVFPAVQNAKISNNAIAPIIQEIVCRGAGVVVGTCPAAVAGNWTSGNDLMLMVFGTGKRETESFNGEPANAPVLRVTYNTGPLSTADQIIALRFPKVDIPQGYTITDAHIEFRVATPSTDGLDGTIDDAFTIAIEATDDAAPIGAADNDITSRTPAPITLSWSAAEGLTDWTIGPAIDPESGLPVENTFQTPDLAGLIQQVTDRPMWCGGNALLIGLSSASPAASRIAHSFESNPSAAPILRVNFDKVTIPVGATGCNAQEYTATVKTGADDAEESTVTQVIDRDSSDLELSTDADQQVIGIRFQDIPIPQGANILDADITFTVDETNTGATTLLIEGHDVDSAPIFSTGNQDISSRARTGQSVPWPTLPSWTTVGSKYSTPDIKDIVKEIVDRPLWAPGNDMVFILTGTGERTAESYNGDPLSAPKLRIRIEGSLVSGSGPTTVRQRLLDIVDELEYKTGTPIVDTLYEAALYFRGELVDYGLVRGDQGSRSEYTRVSHPASYTGGTGVLRTGACSLLNLNSLDCITEAIQGPARYVSPIEFDCQTHHIVLLTDGSPSVNTSVARIEAMTNTTCTGSGSGKCGPELVKFLHDNDQSSTITRSEVITHVIGFNFSSSYIRDLALISSFPEGRYAEADSAAELVAAFSAILADILSQPTSFATPSLTVNAFNKLFVRNEVYFSLFEPEKDVRWQGNVKKYLLCDQELITERGDTTPCILGEILDNGANPAIDATSKIDPDSVNLWTDAPGTGDGPDVTMQGAQAFVPEHTVRDSVYTYTDSVDPILVGGGVDLTLAAHRVTDANTDLTGTLLGNVAMTAGDRTDLINWIRGQDVDNLEAPAGIAVSRFRFGDPLHASPIAVTFGGTDAIPVIKIFTATNDGTVRMINSATGEEEWVFIPQALLPLQATLRADLGEDHPYGMDLTPIVWQSDVNADGVITAAEGDFVRIIMGMRRGGRNMYALDVTPALVVPLDPTINGSVQPKLLWRIEGGTTNFPKLCETWSPPQLTNIRFDDAGSIIIKTVLIFGGGNNEGVDEIYGDSTSKGNAVYIVDPATGSRIWHVSNAGADVNIPTMIFPVTAPVAIFDSDGDNVTDRMYVPDIGGNIHRVDLGPTLGVGANGGTVVGLLADVALSAGAVTGPLGAETRKFYHGVDVVQVNETLFSNEARYDMVVTVSGSRPKPRNLVTHNTIYAFRDFDTAGMPDGDNNNLADSAFPTRDPALVNTGPLTRADLSDLTANPLQVDAGGSFSNPTADDFINDPSTGFRTRSGSLIDLIEDPADPTSFIGEKGLARPITLAGKLFFTTYVPTITAALQASCQLAEGEGRLYGIDILTGAALFADWDSGDGGGADPTTGDRSLTLGGGLPSEAVPVFQKKGLTIIVGGGGGATTVKPGIGLPRERTYWYQQ